MYVLRNKWKTDKFGDGRVFREMKYWENEQKSPIRSRKRSELKSYEKYVEKRSLLYDQYLACSLLGRWSFMDQINDSGC